MSGKVKVFNYNHHPIEEIFKGEALRIDANDYWRDKAGRIKELDIFEANDYRGQYRPVPFDGSGKMIDDARYHKKIRLEPVDPGAGTTGADAPLFKCMAQGCKHTSPSEAELEAHTKKLHPNAETLVLPEQDTELKRRKG